MSSTNDLEKKRKFITNNTIKCKCGHSVFFQRNKMICTWCGRFVYKNEKEEFKDKLISQLNKKNRDDGYCIKMNY